MTPQIWIFKTSEEAYDLCQTDERIKDGDILVVSGESDSGPEEGVGILVNAWPTALDDQHLLGLPAFHQLGTNHTWQTMDDGKYWDAYQLAVRIFITDVAYA